MANDISLTSGMRSNLLQLQGTGSLMDRTQNRIATGKKVNSSLDSPVAFFAAKALTDRAGDMASLKDAMGQAISTIKQADQGITSITNLAQSAKGLTSSALAKMSNSADDVAYRSALASQFNTLMQQISDVAVDSDYGGRNLLLGSGAVHAATTASLTTATSNLQGITSPAVTNVQSTDVGKDITVTVEAIAGGTAAYTTNATQLAAAGTAVGINITGVTGLTAAGTLRVTSTDMQDGTTKLTFSQYNSGGTAVANRTGTVDVTISNTAGWDAARTATLSNGTVVTFGAAGRFTGYGYSGGTIASTQGDISNVTVAGAAYDNTASGTKIPTFGVTAGGLATLTVGTETGTVQMGSIALAETAASPDATTITYAGDFKVAAGDVFKVTVSHAGGTASEYTVTAGTDGSTQAQLLDALAVKINGTKPLGATANMTATHSNGVITVTAGDAGVEYTVSATMTNGAAKSYTTSAGGLDMSYTVAAGQEVTVSGAGNVAATGMVTTVNTASLAITGTTRTPGVGQVVLTAPAADTSTVIASTTSETTAGNNSGVAAAAANVVVANPIAHVAGTTAGQWTVDFTGQTFTTGQVVTMEFIVDDNGANDKVLLSYEVQAGDTGTQVAAGLDALFNATDLTLYTNGVPAATIVAGDVTAAAGVITVNAGSNISQDTLSGFAVKVANPTQLTGSLSNTVPHVNGTTAGVWSVDLRGQTFTTNQVVTMDLYEGGLYKGQASYTVAAGNTAIEVAAGLVADMDALYSGAAVATDNGNGTIGIVAAGTAAANKLTFGQSNVYVANPATTEQTTINLAGLTFEQGERLSIDIGGITVTTDALGAGATISSALDALKAKIEANTSVYGAGNDVGTVTKVGDTLVLTAQTTAAAGAFTATNVSRVARPNHDTSLVAQQGDYRVTVSQAGVGSVTRSMVPTGTQGTLIEGKNDFTMVDAAGIAGVTVSLNVARASLQNGNTSTIALAQSVAAGTANDLSVTFNENGSSAVAIASIDVTKAGLKLGDATNNWVSRADIDNAVAQLDKALISLRSAASNLSTNLSVVQAREDFTTNLISTLQEGADKLTLADSNEEGANMLMLQTRQQLGTISLSMASQSAQSILRLFG